MLRYWRRPDPATARPQSGEHARARPGGALGRKATRREDGSIDPDSRASGGAPWTFALLLALYGIVHASLRVWISPILNIDDARETVFSQTLAWGYQPRQPPLYTWLVWAAVRAAGVRVASLTVLKYAVLAVAYVFAYLTARRVLEDPRLAPVAAFSLLLLLPVGWFVHDDLTQSVAVLATAAATVYVLLCVEAAPTSGRYAWLGVAIALGTLSKLTYLVFGAALGLAALTVAPYRRRLLDARALVALLVAVVLVLPYALWLATYPDDLSRFAQQVAPGSMRSYAAGVTEGLGAVLRAFAYYAAPLALVFLVLFPEVYRRRVCAGEGRRVDAGILIGRTILAGLGLLVVGAFLNVLGQLKFRWAIPLFFLLPLYACWRLGRLGMDLRRLGRLRAYTAVLAAAEGLMIAGILLQTFTGARVGMPARLNTPYDAVGRAAAGDGFRRGTIVAGPGPLGGNMRLAFPDSRVASLETPGYLPPAAGAADGDCLLVWERGPADALPEEFAGWLRSRLGVEAPAPSSIVSVTVPHRHGPALELRAFLVRLPEGSGRCR